MVSTREEQALLGYFDAWTLVKGQQYFREDRVRNAYLGPGEVGGSVLGTYFYNCKVTLSPDFARIKNTSCSCPLRSDCKHTAALMFFYLKMRARTDATEVSIPELNNVVMLHSAERSTRRSSPTMAAENASSKPQANPQLESALRYLSWTLESEKSADEDEADSYQNKKSARKAFLVYVISDVRSLTPSISIEKTAILKDGTLGKSTPVSIPRLLDEYNLPPYVQKADADIASFWDCIQGRDYYYSLNSNPLLKDPDLVQVLMAKILATGRCYKIGDFKHPLKSGPQLPGEFEWFETADGKQHLRVVAIDGEQRHPCLRWGIPWYINPQNFACGPIVLPASVDVIAAALQLPSISAKDAEGLQILVPELGLDKVIPKPKSARKVELRLLKPVPALSVDPVERTVKLSYDFPDLQKERLEAVPPADTDAFIEVRHDTRAVTVFADRIKSLGFSEASEPRKSTPRNVFFLRATTDDAWLRLYEAGKELIASGWRITEETLAQLRPLELNDASFDFQVEEDNWWFSLAMNIEIGGKKVPLLPLLLAAIKALPDSEMYSIESIDKLNKDGKFYGILDDYQPVSLPFDRIRPILIFLHELLLKDSLNDLDLKLSVMDASRFLDETAAQKDLWKGADGLQALHQRLKNLTKAQDCQAPAGLKAELRPYQLEGLAWLEKLRANGFAGILADDMGLGKTIQLLALICKAKESGELQQKPFLVVCPTSVLPNWLSECEKFAPSLNVLPLSGPDRTQRFKLIEQSDLVLSTYPLISRDIDVLKTINWGGIALDEAQVIKNRNSLMAKTARLLKSESRFCLTGTPIENHLGELWSQFQFLMPGFLGEAKDFKTVFRTPIEKQGDKRKNAILSHRVNPFILRRKKQEVAKDLPEKTEIVKVVEFEGAQLDLYETVRLTSTKRVRDEIAAKGFKKSQIMILDALLKLRQVCCDPRLVKLEQAKRVTQSAKLDALMEMLVELNDEGRKVLVFSQFTSMLDLIAVELNNNSIPFVELRGDTNDRVEPVRQFQNGEVPVFLLSLKAGGTGLNLTAADTVIHYDPWWNPAVEDQATDRAHRIGQSKNVFVYKLVVKGSIEEKMEELKASKQALADAIYSGAGSSGYAIQQEDIDLLLRPIHAFE